ncbi:MAG: carboxypeptidase-like regulatory domain-containing protein [Terriglobia bacterium]
MRSCKVLGGIFFALLMGLLLTPKVSRAQNVYGSIRGTVTDQSGAVVPGATVTITNEGTGISTSLTTGANGAFQFVNLLAPATYDVVVQRSGFTRFVNKGIHLDVNQTYVVKAAMQVGQVSQQVTVEANPVQVETTSMQLGVTITGSQIVNLPLNGRNWTQLQQLEPGVVASSDRFGTYSTNGAETQQNAFLINGLDTNDLPLNTAGFIPSPDAIGEFRMITNTINPEYGRNSGAIMNATIKSGTNQFHGDGFEFYRDTTLDARSFFQSSVSPFHQNEFGGTIGGPIKKDHAFFFFSYQGYRNAVPQGFSVPTVFSAAERGGNFSDILPGGVFPTINPNSSAPAVSAFPLVGDNGKTYPAGTPYATLFPNGAIPQADLNPLAVKLMNQFVPLPNAPSNGYTFNPTTTQKDDQYVYRVDENIRTQDTISVNGSWERHPSVDTLPFSGATVPGFAETAQRHIQTYTGTWNHTFSANTLNNARFSYFRFNFVAVEPVSPINPTSYGFTGILPQTSTGASLPIVSLSGFFTLGFSANGPQPRIDQTYDVADNFTRIMGHHTFKAGFEMQRFEVANPFFNNLSGNFSYNGSGSFSTSNPGADFLLGVADSYAQGSGSIINARGRQYYSYGQDQWQVKHNLTLTYGLGWDIETPYQNLYDNGLTMMAFRPGEQSTVFPTAPVGLVYPGDPGINKYGGPTTHLTDLAPRLGFAWTPGSSSKWSVRAGFGLYYNRTEEELALQGLTNPPFSTASSTVAALGGTPSFATPFTGWCPGSGGASPAPCSVPQTFPFTPPSKGAKVDFTPFEPVGFGMNTLSPNFGTPMAQNYNLTIERQLSPSTIFSMGYVGSVGRHLEGAYNYNMANVPNGVNAGGAALGCNVGSLPTCDPGVFPFDPSIYGAPGLQVTDFNSNYNSLQVEFNRHFAKGLQLQASYTWSRYFDQTSNLENNAFNGPGINTYNFASMYAPSANDAPQRLALNYFYTLPFYSLTHKWQRLTDGWSLSGLTTFQSGFPVAVTDNAFTSLTCMITLAFYDCPDRANVTSTPLGIGNPRNYTVGTKVNYWFNPKAFARPPAGTGIGNASRNPLYGPGINNWDIELLKDLHITESKYFEFRVEAYNAFNQVLFSNPNGNVSSSNFGRITGVLQGSTNGSGRVLQLGGKFYF